MFFLLSFWLYQVLQYKFESWNYLFEEVRKKEKKLIDKPVSLLGCCGTPRGRGRRRSRTLGGAGRPGSVELASAGSNLRSLSQHWWPPQPWPLQKQRNIWTEVLILLKIFDSPRPISARAELSLEVLGGQAVWLELIPVCRPLNLSP